MTVLYFWSRYIREKSCVPLSEKSFVSIKSLMCIVNNNNIVWIEYLESPLSDGGRRSNSI